MCFFVAANVQFCPAGRQQGQGQGRLDLGYVSYKKYVFYYNVLVRRAGNQLQPFWAAPRLVRLQYAESHFSSLLSDIYSVLFYIHVGFQAPPQRSNSHDAGIHLVTSNAKNSLRWIFYLSSSSYKHTSTKHSLYDISFFLSSVLRLHALPQV